MTYRHNLHPADASLLRHLRQLVDRLDHEQYRLDAHPNVKQDLARAREELKEFTSKLRKQGINI